MKTGILGAYVAAVGLLACGVGISDVNGSGDVVTQQMSISDFTRVEAGNSFKVNITQADSFDVQIRADDNLVEFLDVRKADETLVINLIPGRSPRNATLEADVSLPEST